MGVRRPGRLRWGARPSAGPSPQGPSCLRTCWTTLPARAARRAPRPRCPGAPPGEAPAPTGAAKRCRRSSSVTGCSAAGRVSPPPLRATASATAMVMSRTFSSRMTARWSFAAGAAGFGAVGWSARSCCGTMARSGTAPAAPRLDGRWPTGRPRRAAAARARPPPRPRSGRLPQSKIRWLRTTSPCPWPGYRFFSWVAAPGPGPPITATRVEAPGLAPPSLRRSTILEQTAPATAAFHSQLVTGLAGMRTSKACARH
mmetsp:Transcript_9320/g.26761  ORF Transcript_9320/g.26761 Transcript_9320/m.26761 type:complete len:257 (+) Transcript_9320:750-1520(+)